MSAAAPFTATKTVPIPIIPVGQPNITTGAPTTGADQAVAMARDLPDLIAKASTFDPALAAKFTGQALIASKSPWGSLAGGVVAWAVTHWGLGWDQSTCDLVAGAGVLVGAYAMRYVTDHPITGLFRKATVAEVTAPKGATS